MNFKQSVLTFYRLNGHKSYESYLKDIKNQKEKVKNTMKSNVCQLNSSVSLLKTLVGTGKSEKILPYNPTLHDEQSWSLEISDVLTESLEIYGQVAEDNNIFDTNCKNVQEISRSKFFKSRSDVQNIVNKTSTA